MTSTAAPLHYVARPPAAPGQPHPLLVLLHGYGSNEADLMGLAPYLDPRLGMVGVRAPLDMGMGGYAWYHLEWTPQGLQIDIPGALAARAQVLDLLQDICQQWSVNAADIYLLGFSQGASIALGAALESPQRLGGVAFLSGLYHPDALPKQLAEHLLELPILMTHGRHDPTIPIADGQTTRDLFAALPLALDYREYDMGHEINSDCLEDLRDWLSQRLEA